jgi:hypothetical protein
MFNLGKAAEAASVEDVEEVAQAVMEEGADAECLQTKRLEEMEVSPHLYVAPQGRLCPQQEQGWLPRSN